jgi:hypothetical protein
MYFTVAVCTRNRAASLARMLRSLVEASTPNCDWEILVIDNGSSDTTQAVITSFINLLPIRSELENLAGLSHARNKAVKCARGEYIVWTDDDVVVEPGWLVSYASYFRRWPDAAIFGGKITPVLAEPAVPWFRAALPMLNFPLAARDFGSLPIPISVEGDVMPFGANFATRVIEQRHFLYDPALGVAPGRHLMGEETVVIKAMLAAGHRGVWVPDCGVKHMIGFERQTSKYISSYFEALGATEIHLQGKPVGPFFWGVPKWLWRRALTRLVSYWAYRLVSPPEIWIRKLILLAQDKGKIKYLRQPNAKR